MTCSAGSGDSARKPRSTGSHRPTGLAPDGPFGEPTDLDLLQAHVHGDRDAFGRLFQRHRDRLWAVALRTLADREEAADALQDAMLSAYRAAGRFRGDAAVTTWLHRIVVNACLDRIRRRQAHPTVPLPDGSHSDDAPSRRSAGAEPAMAQPDHDTVLVVRAALAALPVEQRTALVLVDVQGYPVAEVASMLGVAEGTVKSRCARGRARLARMLGDLTDGPGRERPEHGRTGRDRPGGQRAGSSGSPPVRRSEPVAEPSAQVPAVTSGNPRQRTGVRSESTSVGRDQLREEQ